jgi:hypothetical protein
MADREKIQFDLFKLANGGRLLRLSSQMRQRPGVRVARRRFSPEHERCFISTQRRGETQSFAKKKENLSAFLCASAFLSVSQSAQEKAEGPFDDAEIHLLADQPFAPGNRPKYEVHD